MPRRRSPKCPKCNAAMIPIEYGFPDDALLEAAERGEVRIGGCIIDADNPDLVCEGAEHHGWQRAERGGLRAIALRGSPTWGASPAGGP